MYVVFKVQTLNGPVAQLVRAPPCHGGGREFESLLGRLLVTFSEQAINNYIWDHSSAGRASALQAEGHRFEPYWSHFVRKFFKVENIEREMWRALRAMHTALKSWHKNISYGGIAQLARARGSYPRCRWFKSSSRYFEKGLYKPFFYFFKEQTDTGKLIIAKVTVVAARRISGESSSVK